MTSSPTTPTTPTKEARMGYTADLPGRAPGRPDLRPVRDALALRADHEAMLRRRRLRAAQNTRVSTRSLMGAPTSSKGD